MKRIDELKYKTGIIREYIEKKGADAIALQRSDNFAWATCGGSNHVNTATDAGVAALVITPADCFAATNRIEAGRLLDEELAGFDIEIKQIPWADDRNAFIVETTGRRKKILSDVAAAGFDTLENDFIELQMSLTPPELERFRALGVATGAALEAAARSLAPGMTENEVAARLAAECYSRDVLPIVALIAADDRLLKYRHPIPTQNRIEKTVMLVVCGRRRGLIASATRIVNFGAVDPELERRHAACVRVDAAFNSLTRPDAALVDIFITATNEYRDAGFDGEWLLHHQGGPCGYRTRYFTASEKTAGVVRPGMAFAWNPSIAGTKSEDTIIVLEDKNEFITQTGNWPCIETEFNGIKMSRPDILSL